MVTLDGPVVVDSGLLGIGPAAGRFASLRTHDLRDGFFAWHGASGRRYVASVFTFDACAAGAGLPAFEAFVLIPVVREGGRAKAQAVVVVEWGSSRLRAIAEAIAGGVHEWHVHLLGASRAERERIAADLRVGAGLELGVACSARQAGA